MIYKGQYQKNPTATPLDIGLWRMRQTEKFLIFERVSDNKSLRVKKEQKGRYGYVRPLYEDSWTIFDNTWFPSYYEFMWITPSTTKPNSI